MNQKKEAEAWMDKITQEEADKQWKKEQDAWAKQERARIELLKQVYKERDNAVYFNKNVQVHEKEELLKEREMIDNEIKVFNERMEKIKLEEALRRKKHQDDLLYQIEVKNKHRLKETQDKIYEERAAKLWELEYQKKLNAQKELHFKRVNNIFF